MKKINLFLLVLFTACFEPKTALVEHTHAAGNVKVWVEGKKEEMVGPWKVTMRFKVYNFEQSKIDVEIYADEISETTVKFNWTDETNCIISFTESDGKERKFKLIAAPNNMEVVSMHK